MGPFGFQELLVILVIILLLFGAKKLPELARGLGRSVSEFRHAQQDVKDEFEKAMQADEKKASSTSEEAESKTKKKTSSAEKKNNG